MNILCPKCKKEIALTKRVCDCGFKIRKEKGIWLLTAKKQPVQDKENIPYTSYTRIAKFYDKTHRDFRMHLETAKFLFNHWLKPEYTVLDLGAGTGTLITA